MGTLSDICLIFLSMPLRISEPKPSVLLPSVPTQSFCVSRSLTLSMAFLRPPLQCVLGEMCQCLCPLSESVLLARDAERRVVERDCLRWRRAQCWTSWWAVWNLRARNNVNARSREGGGGDDDFDSESWDDPEVGVETARGVAPG